MAIGYARGAAIGAAVAAGFAAWQATWPEKTPRVVTDKIGIETTATSDAGDATALSATKTVAKSRPLYARASAANRSAGIVPVMSAGDLALHDGTDTSRPLLLCILGEVYDVGPGHAFYAPGGDYAGLAGKDGSLGFITGEFRFEGSDEGSDISGLPVDDVKNILHWRNFYRTHPAYHLVAVLAGRFYSETGAPLPALREAEKVYGRWRRTEEVYEEVDSRYTMCHAKVTDGKISYRCNDEDHGRGTSPVHFSWVIRSPDPSDHPQMDERCACVTTSQRVAVERAGAYSESDGVTANIRFTDYPGCKPGKRYCKPTGVVVLD